MDFEILQIKKELDLLIRDFKKFNTAFRFFSLFVYILFIVYMLCVGAGYLALNIFLLVISLGYLAFASVLTVRQAKGKNTTKSDKIAARIYHWAKFAAVFVSAVLSIVGVLTAVERTTPLSVVLAILLPVCLILQILFDLVIAWITVRVSRFKIALSEDMEMLKRDMVKLAIGLIRDSLFRRNRDVRKNGDEPAPGEGEDGAIIVVGSDEALSVKAMKNAESNGSSSRKREKTGFFKKIFGKRAGGRKTEIVLPAGEEILEKEE